MDRESLHIVAVQVGNTRTRFAEFRGKEMQGESGVHPNADLDAIARQLEQRIEAAHDAKIVLASVNDKVAGELARRIADRTGEEVFRIGRDIPLRMAHTLDDASTVGQDRLLCALGAFRRAEQACVVVDAGTAVTVDFVDGEGTFHGGIIAPGLNMMLRAMHEQTAALPSLAFELPDAARGVFGKDTRHAMQLGVLNAVRGLVHRMVEQYAIYYEAYPQIVATGGDAQALFAEDEVIEHIVPELQLIGIAEACAAEVAEGGSETDLDDDAGRARGHATDEDPDDDL